MAIMFLAPGTLHFYPAMGVTWPLCFLRPVLGYSENFTILDGGENR